VVEGHAGVVKLVDAPDSKSGSERSVGSIPTARTIFFEPWHPATGPMQVTFIHGWLIFLP
jgi:hypothetical protein